MYKTQKEQLFKLYVVGYDITNKQLTSILTTPLDSLINGDKIAEIPGCWVATINAPAQKQLWTVELWLIKLWTSVVCDVIANHI